MVRTKGFTFCCPFLAIEPSLLLSFSSSSSRLLRVLVVIGANREKHSRRVANGQSSITRTSTRTRPIGGITQGLKPAKCSPAGTPIWSRIRWTRVSTRSSTEAGLPVPGVFAQGPRSASAFPRPLIVLVLVLVLVIVS
jgi:hypothetical protein